MRMVPAVVRSRGRIVLPREVRVELGLAEGDTVFFVLGPDGVRLTQAPQDTAAYMALYGSGPDANDLDLPAPRMDEGSA